MSYYLKYLKYKTKYLQLKNLQFGGDQPLITNIDKINLFTDQEMETYLNPIYGMILCNNGYIPNNFFLSKSKFINTENSKIINTENSKIIKKTCKNINGITQPTNNIMDLDAIDFGRYIAIKYINMKYNFLKIGKDGNNIGNIQSERRDKIIVLPEDLKKINSYATKLRKYIPFESSDKFCFQIILYCFWWCANNDNGIIQYYNGINEVIEMLNKYLPDDNKLVGIDLNNQSNNPNSFEHIIFKICSKPFKIYNHEQAKKFCSIQDQSTYPDCGEVTCRNFINLLCFENGKFNLDILRNLGAIEKLLEYYQVFNNFNLQSDIDINIMIYGENLNARDAWSKLIIEYCSKNIHFDQKCDMYNKGYELDTGLSLDGKTSNFFQLVKNLFNQKPIENWSDIKTEYINNITDNTDNKGFGNILISHKIYGDFTIFCNKGHFYMEYNKITNDTTNTFSSELSTEQQEIVNILLKKQEVTVNNYLLFDFTSEFLEKVFKNTQNNELKIKLFELSLTDKYDSDLRRRLEIDADSEFFNDIVKNYGYLLSNSNVNEYVYLSNDLEFVKKIPDLKNLNFKIKNVKITSIDLSGLSNVTSIGNGFLSECNLLETINLSTLSNVTSIGNGFLSECVLLETINLSPLSNVTSIGNNFLAKCGLETIDLSSLSNVTSIGNDFLYACRLRNIDLSSLSNVISIGYGFLSSCPLSSINLSSLSNLTSIGNSFLSDNYLKNIDLKGLTNLTSIGNYFLSGCESLTSINLSCLSNLTSIGDYFLYKCSLSSIDLSGLSNLTTIGNKFLLDCKSLTKIDLIGLTKLTSIGDYFLYNFELLKSINLSDLSNLTSIGNYFLYNCKLLKSIKLSGLSNLKSIGDDSLVSCNSLSDIDLSGLSNLTSIGNLFLYGCKSLTSINLSGLSKLTSIGNRFLYEGKSLTSINLSGISNLTSIGDEFLGRCNSLNNINLSGLSNLTSIGEKFLYYCSNLTSIDLSDLSNLTSIRNSFLYGCNKLKTIICTKDQYDNIKKVMFSDITFEIKI